MRSITVLWAETEIGSPVYASHLKSTWQPGEDVAELLIDAVTTHPNSTPEMIESMAADQDGLVLAVLEGDLRPLYVHDGESVW